MVPPNQESASLYTPSTFGPSTLHTATLQPSSGNFRLDSGASSPEKRPRGRPKGSFKKRPTLESGQNIGDLPKRPRGRPRKLEVADTPKRPRGRPKKNADTESIPTHEMLHSEPTDISMAFKAEPMIGPAASTSGQTIEFRRSSSTAFHSVQTFSLGHDNAVGRWDVEQLVLNMTRGSDSQLAVKGTISLSLRAQELSREERETLGQNLMAPLLQDCERINIVFTGQGTSQ